MAHHRIIIETADCGNGQFRADVVDGPLWARGEWGEAETARAAYADLMIWLCARRPRDTIAFIHVHAQETT